MIRWWRMPRLFHPEKRYYVIQVSPTWAEGFCPEWIVSEDPERISAGYVKQYSEGPMPLSWAQDLAQEHRETYAAAYAEHAPGNETFL